MERRKRGTGKGEPGRKEASAAKPAPASRNIAAALARKPSRKVAREMLLLETRRLRGIFKEIAQRYMEEMEARIASAISAIETRPLPPQKAGELLETVQSLSVKARKGRRKDLARIEKVTDALLKGLEE